MSYLKSMATNKAKSQAYSDKEKVVHVGGIDLLMCWLPAAFPAAEEGAGVVRQRHRLGQVHQGHQDAWHGRRLWAWSFDPAGKWHQIDQDGIVSHAMPCL